MNKQEELYLKAKEEYYKGTPIMSDSDFDILEEKLNSQNSPVTKIVGSRTGNSSKIAHITPMLSLSKKSVKDNDNLPLEEIKPFLNKAKIKEYEATPKFDGNAVNMIYDNGLMEIALTRGDGDKGFDVTSKLIYLAPTEIKDKRRLEIRGEIVIAVDIFNKKYSEYANPRNFAAGILGRDDKFENIIKDFTFVAYDIKEGNEHLKDGLKLLSELGFNKENEIFSMNFSSIDDFENIYKSFLHYRENLSKFQLDGFVIKMSTEDRKRLGEDSHSPLGCLAIKFPPKESITEILSIDWKTGTTGEIIPTAVMRTIELDGTQVSRAALFNWGNVKEKKAFPGAKVLIAKAGDIIPQIYEVVTPSENEIEPPHECPTCKSKTIIDGIHIWCSNEECHSVVINKIKAGLGVFDVENIGGSSVEQLFLGGIKNITDYFNPEKFNEESLIKTGFFKKGRKLEILLNAISSIKEVKLQQVIQCFKFPETGNSVSLEVAKYLSGVPYDFKGLTKTAIEKFTENTNSKEYITVHNFIKQLENQGIKVIRESQTNAINSNINSLKIVLTGSPKSHGFKTKEEYLNSFNPGQIIEVDKLDKDTSYLVTDDLSSSSSKMAKANKLGIKIITYSDLKNICQ